MGFFQVDTHLVFMGRTDEEREMMWAAFSQPARGHARPWPGVCGRQQRHPPPSRASEGTLGFKAAVTKHNRDSVRVVTVALPLSTAQSVLLQSEGDEQASAP